MQKNEAKNDNWSSGNSGNSGKKDKKSNSDSSNSPSNSNSNNPPNSSNSKSNSKSKSNSSSKSSDKLKPNPIADKLGKDGKLTSEERERRMKEKLCLYCGKAGHKAPECDKAAAAKARAVTVESKDSVDSKK